MKIRWTPQYEPWDAPKPSDEAWRALYKLWAEVKEARLAPSKKTSWVFGLVNPETREFGLVTYIYDELPALRLVRGAEGVEAIFTFESAPDRVRHLSETPLINIEWVPRQVVTEEEIQRLDRLGLDFSEQGKGLRVTSVRPGFGPYSPTARELRFLKLAVQKIVELAPRLDELSSQSNSWFLQFPTLVPSRKKGGKWKLVPDLQLDLPPQKFPVSPQLLRKARALPQGPESFTVYLGWMGAVEPTTEEGFPFVIPYFLLTIESFFGEESRATMLIPKLSLDDVYRRVPDALLDQLLDIGRRPAVLHTTQEKIADILAAMEKPLGVEVNLGDPPPGLDAAIESAYTVFRNKLDEL